MVTTANKARFLNCQGSCNPRSENPDPEAPKICDEGEESKNKNNRRSFDYTGRMKPRPVPLRMTVCSESEAPDDSFVVSRATRI